ncbi:hypothetical protein D3C84_1091800 [compost metagenome]
MSCCWARAPPMKSGELVNVRVGLFVSGDVRAGLDNQSKAFFITPEIPWLYSGEASIAPSTRLTASRNATTGAGTSSTS